MRAYKRSGYSKETADEYVSDTLPIYLVSTGLEKQYKYEDGKRTDEITGYKAWFSQEGLPPFTVKFETEIKLPEYMSLVNFEDLTAIEVRYNVYFKAVGITEVK